MPPKKGKKLKKQEDDALWAGSEANIPGLDALQDEQDEQTRRPAPSFAAMASLNIDEEDPFAGEDMSGGLMGAIQANVNKKKKKGKTKIKLVDDTRSPESPANESSNLPATERDAEDGSDGAADEHWALPNKIKKARQPLTEHGEPQQLKPDDAGDNVGEDHDDSAISTRVLSKKAKEKLKKEREKAKKNAQSQAKKAEVVTAETQPPADAVSPLPTPTPPLPHDPPADDEDEDELDEPGNKADKKKKKKKKKPATKEETKEPPKKKSAAGVAALRALVEQQRAAEEEARRREEEERLRIEEEERKAAEEARIREEAKLRKKEKEKAKRELAKKEGRLLTDKQKKERAQAETAKKALIASGVRIEGLEREREAESTATGAKRVVYGNKKKRPTAQQGPIAQDSTTPATSNKDVVASVTDAPGSAMSVATDLSDGVKDEWDASTDEDINDSPARAGSVKNQATSTSIQPSRPSQNSGLTPPAQTARSGGKLPPKPTLASDEIGESTTEGSDAGSDDSESISGSDSDESSGSDDLTVAQKQALARKAEAAERRAQRHEEALAARSKEDLRSPICCILGHVDTGKTKLLDKIRQTNVQEAEAGGITQQIGATYFPVSAIKEKTVVMNKDGSQKYNIPGLLVIDTPGHESFTNLRSRGSSLCNIAVLVVDIMHGLEPQTLESLRLLRERKTPFVVALNKIDRMYGWVPTPDGAFQESLAKQTPQVQREFARRSEETFVAFSEQGLNAVLYYENKNMAKNVSLVPTSAITGEGVPDLIMLLVHLTQTRMSDRLMYLSEVECTILEVKIIEGLGTTIDVVLSNGVLHEGDKIVLCGLNGPIVTQIRALLTPQPMRELRIKSAYVHNKEVKAALGVKITATDLDKAIAGSRLMVCGPDDEEDDLKDEVMSDLTNLLSSVDRSGRGVSVQASTLGSLEALLEFLKVSKIPVASIGLGPVHKRDIMQAAIMVEKAKELACVLCFDVTVDKDAEKIAEEYGIKIFKADIIYHLFDAFTAYNAEILEAKRKDAAPQAIWPCRLKIIAVFTKRDPIILGVDIIDGTLRVGTPLCVVKTDTATGKRDIIPLGKITSLEINHKPMEIVKKSQAGGGVAVKIEHAVYQSAKMYGRHFDDKDELLSHITRQSIDILKEAFREEMTKEDALLIKGLKQRLGVD